MWLCFCKVFNQLNLDPTKYIQIDEKNISPESFQGIIENFVLEEGTDYGEIEYSLKEKVAMVAQQIREKKAALVYDREKETCVVVLQPI